MSITKPINPRVSVVIPAYNADRYIASTLRSVLDQSLEDIEVIVVNDGSRDKTADIVAAFAQQDPRIQLLQQPRSGVAAARNLAIQHSQADYIAPIDSDDIWHPLALESLMHCLDHAEPDVGIAYAWSIVIDQQGRSTDNFVVSDIQGEVYKTLVCHNFIGNCSAALIRRQCFSAIGSYDTYLREQDAQGCEDWDRHLRIAQSYKFRRVPLFLVGYRKTPYSMSADLQSMARSHWLVMQAANNRYPILPRFFYKFSRVNFYLYLANQSNSYSNHYETLCWLGKALGENIFLSLFRLGIYSLFVKSIIGLCNFHFYCITPATTAIDNQVANISNSKTQYSVFCNVTHKWFLINIKLLLGTILHRVLLAI